MRSQILFVSITALLAAALACNAPFANQPDTAATVSAGLTQTVVARETEQASPPTATSEPEVAPTIAATVPGEAPTGSPDLTRPNSPPVHAVRRSSPPLIDGEADEWPELPNAVEQPVFQAQNWNGPDDQRASFAVAWDDANLYLIVEVQDDVHVQTETSETIFRGDSVEVLLDANLEIDHATTSLSADDFQLGLSPGGLTADPAPQPYLWFPAAQSGRPQSIVMAVQPLGEAGFRIEAAIPWSVYHLSPKPGDLFGFTVSVSDNDQPASAEQQSMLSNTPTRSLTDPTTWGTLVLDP